MELVSPSRARCRGNGAEAVTGCQVVSAPATRKDDWMTGAGGVGGSRTEKVGGGAMVGFAIVRGSAKDWFRKEAPSCSVASGNNRGGSVQRKVGSSISGGFNHVLPAKPWPCGPAKIVGSCNSSSSLRAKAICICTSFLTGRVAVGLWLPN